MNRTMTITDPAELRGGDLVTLTSTVSPAVLTARLSHDPDVQRDIVTLSLRIPGINGEHSTSVVVRRDAGTGWTVSATREVPAPEPGTTGTATVCGVEGVRVTTLDEGDFCAVTRCPTCDGRLHDVDTVTSFVPDAPDPAALRAEVERGERVSEARGKNVDRLRQNYIDQMARADAAEARLARLTHEAVREAFNGGFGPGITGRSSWIDTVVRRVLALVAADEQAAAPQPLAEWEHELLAVSEPDGEVFCPRCAAGADSPEHHEKCVTLGWAADGEPAPEGTPTWARHRGPAPSEPWPFAPGDVVRDSGEGDDAAWLAAAPIGTVVRNDDGHLWARAAEDWWLGLGTDNDTRGSKGLAEAAPLTVVSVPDATTALVAEDHS